MSDETSVYKVKEVRFGLFRIYCEHPWNVLNLKEIISNRTELCGSQLGRAVTITLQKFPNRFLVKVLTQSDVVDVGSTVDNEPAPKRQKLNESSKSEEFKTTAVSEMLIQPEQIWLESAVNGSTINTSKLDSWQDDAWKKDKNSWEKCIDVNQSNDSIDDQFSIVVWIDFGTNEVRQTNINKGITDMFYNQIQCDVKFQFEDEQSIGAHIIILSAGSPVFAAMFQSGLKESCTCQVVIEDINIQVFKQLLDYLYTSKVPRITVNKEINIMSLYEAADKYGVMDLKKECYEMLKEVEPDAENAIELLVWSKFHSISELFKKSMHFTLENCKKLCSQPAWLDLIKKQPELCVEINKKMAEMVGAYQYLSAVY